MDNELQPMPQQPVVTHASDSQSMMRLIEASMARPDFDITRLEQLLAVKERWEANEARKAFAEDMARFKAKPLSIYKDKHVSFKTDKGRTDYDHATIGNVCEVIVGALAEFGFSHRWDLEQRDGQVVVACVITHRLGHSQTTTLHAAPDASGGKNGIQSIVSAKTYLQRHTLLAATGMATKDQLDDDGAAAGDELRDLAADMKKPGAKEPAKHLIDGPTLKRALAAIKAEEYTYPELVAYYALTPEQDESARKELGMDAAP